MTSRDFIVKNYDVRDGNERFNSSIFKDGKGYIYSYGRHYPLLFKIRGFNFVNTAGYSVTTAKHIGWAWSAIDYQGIGVPLTDTTAQIISSGFTTDEQKLRAVQSALQIATDELNQQLKAKKRKDTNVYANLLHRYSTLVSAQAMVHGVL